MATKIVKKAITFSFTSSAMTSVNMSATGMWGKLVTFAVNVPAFANEAPSGGLIIKTAEATTWFSTTTSAFAQNATSAPSSVDAKNIYLAGTDSFQMQLGAEPSGDATAIDKDATLYVWIDVRG